jgi:hypothetical protein
MARRDQGLVSMLLPDGRVCRFERTSAFGRARLLSPSGGSELDDVVDDVSGSWWYDGVEEGLVRLGESGSDAEPAVTAVAEVPNGSPRRRRRGAASPDGLVPGGGAAPGPGGTAHAPEGERTVAAHPFRGRLPRGLRPGRKGR